MSKKGFTLVELMITITIMIILMGIIYTSFASSQAKARDLKRVSAIQDISGALARYNSKYRSYPASLADLESSGMITKLPHPPAGSKDAKVLNNTTTDYNYAPLGVLVGVTGSGCIATTTYHLGAVLENDTSSLKDDDDKSSVAGTLGDNAKDCLNLDFDGSIESNMIYDITSPF
ncbi:MAG: prepilin-type N-terminal cleavage/methylation domain-containing protein [Candidatus Taylorbacteria bacterium]|nr:prepilin-type N-terminal cleavage/methylation domain-containing protein [Candidatus Taylorbacteria bacterium]